jgi:hypothetical protein
MFVSTGKLEGTVIWMLKYKKCCFSNKLTWGMTIENLLVPASGCIVILLLLTTRNGILNEHSKHQWRIFLTKTVEFATLNDSCLAKYLSVGWKKKQTIELIVSKCEYFLQGRTDV